jgi:hypothetical protein
MRAVRAAGAPLRRASVSFPQLPHLGVEDASAHPAVRGLRGRRPGEFPVLPVVQLGDFRRAE